MRLDTRRSESPPRTSAIGDAPASSLPVATGIRRHLVGYGVITLIAALHTGHAVSHGYALAVAAFSGAMIVLQCGALTLAHALAHRWNAPRWAMRTGGSLLSATFGLLLLVPLSAPWHLSRAFVWAGGAVVGFSVAVLWLLLFQLPLIVGRARLRALEVESLRRESELARLRVHLHPHFLLNTLNAIAGHVTDDTAEARHLIAALGDLVRDALSDGDELRPFAAEVAWLRCYADILESRHRGLLRFRWELADETLATPVPRLLLQPLVENAVQHGVLRRREGGSVLIRSERLEGGTVRLVVEDDGPGFGPDHAEGLGIRLVRRRLALLCPGGDVRFTPIDTGTRVVVEIPQPREGRA